jgi:hypothetical protein
MSSKVAKNQGFGQEPVMDTLQAIIIAILQGATELFPGQQPRSCRRAACAAALEH